MEFLGSRDGSETWPHIGLLFNMIQNGVKTDLAISENVFAVSENLTQSQRWLTRKKSAYL